MKQRITAAELKAMTMKELAAWVEFNSCAINRTMVMSWGHEELFKGYHIRPEYIGYKAGRLIVKAFHFTSRTRKADAQSFAEWLHWAIFGEYPAEETEETTETAEQVEETETEETETETAAPSAPSANEETTASTEEQTTETTDTEEEEEEETMRNTFTPAEAAMHAATVRGIIRRQGGYRERDIITHPHTVERGETWNEAHKVVEILATTPDPDGYRPGFAVDIVTRSIVG